MNPINCSLFSISLITTTLSGQVLHPDYTAFYQYNNNQLKEITLQSDGFYRSVSVGLPFSFTIQTAAYRREDQSLYLLAKPDNRVYRLDAQGNRTEEGYFYYAENAAERLPALDFRAAEWLGDELWLYVPNSDSVYCLQANTKRYTRRRLNKKMNLLEWALHPSDGHLYGFDYFGHLLEIVPSTGFVHDINKLRNQPVKEAETTGVWFTRDGRLWARRASDAGLWMADIENRTMYELKGDIAADGIGSFGSNAGRSPAWVETELLAFWCEVPAKNNILKLNWTVANEPTMEAYQLEKSRDGRNWQTQNELRQSYRSEGASNPYGDMDRYRQATDSFYYRIAKYSMYNGVQYSRSIQFPIPKQFAQRRIIASPEFGGEHTLLQLRGWENRTILLSVRTAAGQLIEQHRFFIPANDYALSLFSETWLPGWYAVQVVDEVDGFCWNARLWMR